MSGTGPATRRGVYPGTFNPPTTAHLAVAEAAVRTHHLDQLDLVLSRRPLDKEHVEHPTLDERVAVLREVATTRPWLAVRVTDHQLLADIARGYDLLVVGADKYHQLHDVRYYDGDPARMAAALDGLPLLAVAPRSPWEVPAELALDVHPDHHTTSSTRARDGEAGLMLPEAAASGLWSGAPTPPPVG